MKKNLRILLVVLCLAVLLFSVGRIVRIQMDYWNTDKLYKELRDQRFHLQEPLPKEAAKADVFPVVEIDIEGIKEINPEVIGWIWIPGTEVNYPFLQGTDNQTYLSKSYRLEKDLGGSIFMDYRNGADLSDDNTILYGHNMKNGAMFGGLKKFADPTYRKANPTVYLFTQNGIRKYRIFAAYKTDSTSRSYTRDLSGSREEFLSYIASCAGESQIELADKQSRMITLSTCTSVRRTERFVVHAVYESMQPRDSETTF